MCWLSLATHPARCGATWRPTGPCDARSRAAIVDGCARDVDAVAATGFSVWAARIFVGEGSRTGGPGAINVPLTIRGALVEPGDVVVADGDGIGFIPRAMLDEVVAAAEDREREDRRVLAELATNERPSN